MIIIKKVPIVGDIEKGIDNTLKDLMGPLSALYPALKYSVIFSNPASALGYSAYRATPYVAESLINGLKSKAAINCYKKIGKSIAGLGIKGAKLGFKYTKEATKSLAAFTSNQLSKIKEYISEKTKSYENNSYDNYSNEYNLDTSNDLEYEFVMNYQGEVHTDYETEPQLDTNTNEIEVGEDEILINTLSLSSGNYFRFTRDESNTIRQYICLNDFPSQVKEVSESEYNNFIRDYNEKYNNHSLEHSRDYNELSF